MLDGRQLLRSSIFRIALIYLCLFSASVLVLGGIIYWITVGSLTRQIDATIDAEITGLAEQFDQRGLLGLIRAIQRRSDQTPDQRGLYLLTDRNYAPLAGNLTRWPDIKPSDEGWITFPIGEASGEGGGIDFGRGRVFDLGGWYHLLVGHDIRERLFVSQMIRESMAIGVAIVIGLSLIGGVLMSRTLRRQIDAINRTSREIMAGDLARRVPIAGSGDEFDQLAGNLNAMLDKIEQLLAGVRQVSDNIAHDLRSPLTRLRSRLELTLLQDSGSEAYRLAIENTIAEADKLLQTFNALLDIAQAEAGAARRDFEPIDLAALLDDVAELYEPAAEERGLGFEATKQGAVEIPGDRELLFQALANLVDNALKFAPEGGQVSVALSFDQARVRLCVSDNGPGIPAEYRDKVRQRFYRLEASRSTPGSGLGLSLVAAVVELHGGRLELGDNEPGLKATLDLPR
ncbi:MAG: ATP-binding protein [Pseudomonadota bacterium]